MKPSSSQKLAATLSFLAGLALSPHASGTVAFYSTPFDMTDVTNGPVGSSFSGTLFDFQTLELSRFNPALGNLQSVQIQFQSNYQVYILGEARDYRAEFDFFPFGPHNDAGMDVSVQGALQVLLFDPSSSSTTLNFPLVNASCYEQFDDVGIAYCIAQTGGTTGYDAVVPLGAFGLTDFVGTDPINLLTSLNAGFSGTCDSDDLTDECELGVRINWFGFVGVAYTYEIDGVIDPPGGAIPEPATLALLGLGLAGLGFSRRKQ